MNTEWNSPFYSNKPDDLFDRVVEETRKWFEINYQFMDWKLKYDWFIEAKARKKIDSNMQHGQDIIINLRMDL